MKRSDLEFAGMLARKAENDWRIACLGLEHDAPPDTVCFHIQQTAEKLLKALLVSRSQDYRFSHDLKELLFLALPHFPTLAEFQESLPTYTDYATSARYDEVDEPTREEAREAFQVVGRFRAVAHVLLPPAARP